MSRKNIFDIIKEKKDPEEEISRIDILLNQKDGVVDSSDFFADLTKGAHMSILEYIDKYLFLTWKQRGTCVNVNDFRMSLDIYCDTPADENHVLNYCEYAANMVLLIEQGIKSSDYLEKNVEAIKENIRTLLNWYGYEIKVFEVQQKVLVLKKSAQTTAVAEILPSELGCSVLEYNHFLLKGNITRKKEILLALGADLEPKRDELKAIDKTLEKNVFAMLNNLNIRHNNKKKGDKHYKEYVAKMKKNELEKWYNELYQMILLAYLLMDNTERTSQVKELMDKINGMENK